MCGILPAFPQYIRATRQREVLELEVDRSMAWGFYDGAAQNNLCGGGAILFMIENHYFELMVGLGEGSNNFAELLSLKIYSFLQQRKGVEH